MVVKVQTMAYDGDKHPQNEERQEQRLDRAGFRGGTDIKLKELENATEFATVWQ
jgi:hypothetical protein